MTAVTTRDSDELRFDEPASIEEATDRRDVLTERVAQLQSRLTTLNQEKPKKYERTTHAQWQERRQRTIAAWRNATNELQYVKGWLHNALDDARKNEGLSLSETLFHAAKRVMELEQLHALVGLMIADEGGDRTYADVVAHYEKMERPS